MCTGVGTGNGVVVGKGSWERAGAGAPVITTDADVDAGIIPRVGSREIGIDARIAFGLDRRGRGRGMR